MFTMWRILRFRTLLFCLFIVGITLSLFCTKEPDETLFLVVHSFSSTFSQSQFERAVSQTADSLDLNVVLYEQNEFAKLSPAEVDSLLDRSNALALSALDSQWMATLVENKPETAPIIGFDQRPALDMAVYIDSDYYTAGRAAGEYVRSAFGKDGRFAIITPSLQNEESNECIRGFRETLGVAPDRWKQLNILTCNTPNYIISTQFRRLSATEPKPVWLVAGPCNDFLQSLQGDKTENFFITVALDIENQMPQVQQAMFDRLAVKDYSRMGVLVVETFQQIETEQSSLRKLNCGVQVKSWQDLVSLEPQ